MRKENKEFPIPISEEEVKEKGEPIEKSLEENLKDDVYFRYNVLLSLGELKQINLSLLQIMRTLTEIVLKEQEPQKEDKKEEREGTFK